MKQFLRKKLTVVVLLFCTLPATLLAQGDKEKEKTKEKTTRQQIIITRTGDKEEKTIIEIEGDKVKVNGKDVADLKDIQVHVNSLRSPNVMTLRTPAQGRYTMTYDDANWIKADSNRAMLGINTNGNEKGVEIESVVAGTAAEKAGLKKGDVITKIDSRNMEAANDVTDAIRAHKPGDKVTVTYLRDDKEYKATAELGHWKGMDAKSMAMPKIFSENTWRADAFAAPNGQGVFGFAGSRPKLGLSVQDTDDGKGVKVTNVSDEGAAEKAGIKEDDIITQIDDKAVNSADEVAKLIREKKDQPSVRFQLTRGGKSQTIEVKIPRKLKTADL